MPIIKDICNYLESIAPLSLQESYDNAGLITGNLKDEVTGVLCTLDCIETVLEEAIEKNCNLVVAHHPIVFSGLKKLSGGSYIERVIIKAIKNDIAIYAIHTNLDNIQTGVNAKICEKLQLQNTSILAPGKEKLLKLAAFVPQTHTDIVLNALGEAGAGQIGDYQNCSFSVTGEGRFQANKNANPFIGETDKLEKVHEDKVEVIFPTFLKGKVLNALLHHHPYEAVAYDLYQLQNNNPTVGSGMIGKLEKAMPALDFLQYLKEKMQLKVIRHTALTDNSIQKVAVCGGSGSFLLRQALSKKADIFITADYKYHQFFDADNKIIIADIGHFESEQFTRELLFEMLNSKFNDVQLVTSTVNTNPVNYF